MTVSNTYTLKTPILSGKVASTSFLGVRVISFATSFHV